MALDENTSEKTTASSITCIKPIRPEMLVRKYSSGIRVDSPTAFFAAKWTAARIG